jgi:glyoxylase-like metal-dependent hydrolase (beta-lactamase superfamily II)
MAFRKDGLEQPWAEPPPSGAVVEIAPGLLWVRLPLPFRLNHVNVWLLREDDGWTVIDTGCATPELFAIWEGLLAGPMAGLPVRRVVATHGHVDHIGLSGWLAERFDAPFICTLAEWLWARVSHMHDVPGASGAYRDYLLRHGFGPETAGLMVASRGRFVDLSTPLPGALVEIRDGETMRMGGRDWRVIVTRGHAFEHASFHDAASGILIAGDHLLPRISPVIAIYEMTPRADPLGDYLASFSHFSDLPEDTLVLPSHGMPYRGVHRRIASLEEHHGRRLEATLALLSAPMPACELSRTMFPHVDSLDDVGFALGETLAHVSRLVASGDVVETCDAAGKVLFSRR